MSRNVVIQTHVINTGADYISFNLISTSACFPMHGGGEASSP